MDTHELLFQSQQLFYQTYSALLPDNNILYKINPIYPEGGRYYHPLSENLNFSGTEPPLELKPVCNLEFVRCGLVEKKQSALSFLV